ncbi:hypothetical protein [Novosphingobium sp. FKTRR1]|uniref:hypothetical protein n=1 Tax=Novosphingobium sp. FKTRR1 TaxID=2879118 RepID=UPI001CF04A8A|nr:hypothetical protein [Novosphingobium sp. FKTRR1]
MNRLRHLVTGRRNWTALILALVLAMRVIMPQGVMAAPDMTPGHTGQLVVLLCDGSGPVERHLVPLGGKHGQDEAASPCAFAALADHADNADTTTAFTARPSAKALPTGLALPTLAVRDADHHRPPSQGPPLSR